MTVYRPVPMRDAAPSAPVTPSFGRRLLCAIGSHKRALDFVNQLTICTECNRVLSPRYAEIDETHRGRCRFEIDYLLLRARYHGETSGDGLLRWHGQGVPVSDEVAVRWAEASRLEFERADMAGGEL